MIVKTTALCDKLHRSIHFRGYSYPNNAYFNHIHRVLNELEDAYESIINYPFKKNEDTTIPDEVANTPKFQILINNGLLKEVT